jgi:hypothetical protein
MDSIGPQDTGTNNDNTQSVPKLAYILFTGHVTSTNEPNYSLPDSYSLDYSAKLGITRISKAKIVISSHETQALSAECVIHEIGHLFGVQDHYRLNMQETSDEVVNFLNTYPGLVFDNNCIYGLNYLSQDIVLNFTKCSGCEWLIKHYSSHYQHN